MTQFDLYVAYFLTKLLSKWATGDLSEPEAEKALKVYHTMILNPDIFLREEMSNERAKARRPAWEYFQRVLNMGRLLNSLKDNNPAMESWLSSHGHSREECELAMELAQKLIAEQNLNYE